MHLSISLFYSISPILYQIALGSPVPSPQCYDDSGQFPAPAALDCMSAMGVLQNDKYFTTPQRYGVYEDATHRVPRDWAYKSCLVTIDVEDASNTDTFAFSSTMPYFASIEETCVIKKKPGRGFGGYVPIGNGKGFYAIVQYDGDYYPTGPNSRVLLSMNATSNGTASPAA